MGSTPVKRAGRMSRYLLWFQIHKYTGLAVLAFLAIAAATGVILVFETELDATLNPDLFQVAAGAARLPPVELARQVEESLPTLQVIALPLHATEGRALILTVAPRQSGAIEADGPVDQVFVSPLDGSVLGTRKNEPGLDRRHIVRGIYALHTALLAGTWGGRLMGIVALLWLLESVVGIYLSLPKSGPILSKWMRSWQVQWRGQWLRYLNDLHRASGLWICAWVLAFAYSSIGIALYYEAYEPVVRFLSPPAASPFDTPPPVAERQPPAIGFGQALELGTSTARADGLSWPIAAVSYVPDRGLFGVVFTRSGREEYSGFGPITYFLDDRTGKRVYVDDPYRDSAGAKWLRVLYPIHSGQIAGTATIWITIIGGIVLFEIAVTGFVVWFGKRR
jgi:uncharacterized iron-regulated membrane protein